MVFQAYRHLSNVYNCNTRSSSNCGFVPAAPVRSSFLSAFADCKRLRASGFASKVFLVTPINQQ